MVTPTNDQEERERLLKMVGVSEEEFSEAERAGLPQTLSECTPDERLFLYAFRNRDTDEMARLMTRKMLRKGRSAADILKAAIDTDDAETVRAFTKAVNAQINPTPEVWTYERRLAMHVLGVMAVEYPGLPDELFTEGDSSNALQGVIGQVADALIDGMHTLGCPRDLSLSQILDLASTHHPDDEEGDSDE